MRISEIKSMLAETGLPVTYEAWQEHGVPQLPYIVWIMPNSDNFKADDRVYKEVEELHVELYTMRREFGTEQVVEAVLNAHGIVWEKQSVRIDAENENETIYTAEVLIEPEAIEEESNGE